MDRKKHQSNTEIEDQETEEVRFEDVGNSEGTQVQLGPYANSGVTELKLFNNVKGYRGEVKIA